jgi:hypothetical protein
MVRVCFHDGEEISFGILLIQLYSTSITSLYDIVESRKWHSDRLTSSVTHSWSRHDYSLLITRESTGREILVSLERGY